MTDTSGVELQGKVALVTGATRGIGRAAAIELARRGAELVIVGRNPARIAEALTEIQAKSGNVRVSALEGDLSRVDEVRRVAGEFKRTHDRLHVLLNNAGALFHERTLTPEGFETTFALNHLGYFVMTEALLELLKASAPARIINVASEAHRWAKIDFDDLQSEKHYRRFRAYGQSKLANILFTRELARRLEGTGVTANCMHPGVVASGFGSGKGVIAKGIELVAPLMLTPEQGADTAVWLATSPAVEGVSGKYFHKRKEHGASRAAQDDAVARQLWDVTGELVKRAG